MTKNHKNSGPAKKAAKNHSPQTINRPRKNFTLSVEICSVIADAAKRQGMSQSQLVERAVSARLEALGYHF